MLIEKNIENKKTFSKSERKADVDGQKVLFLSSFQIFLKYKNITFKILCTDGETRTPNQWFWRPLLYH